MNYGFIYCLGNQAMPGIYKIGMTERAPTQRCIELSNATAAPLPFELLFYGEVEDPREVERKIHEQFDLERLSCSREFFRGRALTYKLAIEEWCNSIAVTSDGDYYLSVEDLLDQLEACVDDEGRVEVFMRYASLDGIRMWAEGGSVRFSVPNLDMIPRWILAASSICKGVLLQHLPTEHPIKSSSALSLIAAEDSW
ncbi:GIY-YIG nuclease family protein [Pseudomonas aeruginosa]|nr:GIY-YIG nuclease family protein [Pseudomonas aeruginosa]